MITNYEAATSDFGRGMTAGILSVLDHIEGDGPSAYHGEIPVEMQMWLLAVRTKVESMSVGQPIARKRNV